MRLASKQTIPIIHYILSSPSFKQVDIKKETNTSIGRINKVITWLKEKGIIIKQKARYELIAPNKLIEILSNELNIKQTRSYSVALPKEDAMKFIKEKSGVLCTYSSLEQIDDSFSNPDIHAYEDKELIKELNMLDRGSTQIHLYTKPYDQIQTDKKENITSKIQTIIDLISRNENTLIKNLSLDLWQTLQ